MTIVSFVDLWVDCDAQDRDLDCHISAEIRFNSVVNKIDQNYY